jgi:hypothetical protein
MEKAYWPNTSTRRMNHKEYKDLNLLTYFKFLLTGDKND